MEHADHDGEMTPSANQRGAWSFRTRLFALLAVVVLTAVVVTIAANPWSSDAVRSGTASTRDLPVAEQTRAAALETLRDLLDRDEKWDRAIQDFERVHEDPSERKIREDIERIRRCRIMENVAPCSSD
jgi:hypothetical protein